MCYKCHWYIKTFQTVYLKIEEKPEGGRRKTQNWLIQSEKWEPILAQLSLLFVSNASKHLNLIYGLNSIHQQSVTQKEGEMHKEGEEGREGEMKICRIKEV